MKTLHIGHHFFGAGNIGDDFMLAGFLQAMEGSHRQARITCCVPHDREPLRRRFPSVEWLPYDDRTRADCIRGCDAWLGLGGAPFQSAVSSWFADHIAAEASLCQAAGKPMYFLGVGGQDEPAYSHPALAAAVIRAEATWTRDSESAAVLSRLAPGRVREAADLAHIFLEENPPKAGPARIAVALNFEGAEWPALEAALAALERLPARERIWIVQEDRPLPGAERWLHERLKPAVRGRWKLACMPGSTTPATGTTPVTSATSVTGAGFRDLARSWPASEWLLSSRFHATLAGAWAGSRAVVIATNAKLRGAAAECGYPALAADDDPSGIAGMIQACPPPSLERMRARARAARRACEEFFSAAGIASR